jgi:threonine synthase
MDPHGAVGYLGLQEYYKVDPTSVGVFLGTAHPAKFLNVVEPLVSEPIVIPDRLSEVLNQKKHSISLSSSFDEFKDYLLAN